MALTDRSPNGTRGLLALQEWAKQIAAMHGIIVTNMTSCWRDGLAFCAIIYHFRPDLIDYNDLHKENVYENNHMAFSIAEQQLGVPALLDAADMASAERLDKLSIITYLAQLYHCFKDKQPASTATTSPLCTSDLAEGSKLKTISPPPKPLRTSIITDLSLSQPDGILANHREPLTQNTLSGICSVCHKRIYLLERLIIDGKLYHRTCFRCSICSEQLKVGLYRASTSGDSGYECLKHEILADPPGLLHSNREVKLPLIQELPVVSLASSSDLPLNTEQTVTDGGPAQNSTEDNNVAALLQSPASPCSTTDSPATSSEVTMRSASPAPKYLCVVNKMYDSDASGGGDVPIAPPRRKRQSGASSLASSFESIPAALARESAEQQLSEKLDALDKPVPLPRKRAGKETNNSVQQARLKSQSLRPIPPPKPSALKNILSKPPDTLADKIPKEGTLHYPEDLNPFGEEEVDAKEKEVVFRRTSYDDHLNPFADSDDDNGDSSDSASEVHERLPNNRLSMPPLRHQETTDERSGPTRQSMFVGDATSKKKVKRPAPPRPPLPQGGELRKSKNYGKKRPAPPRPRPCRRKIDIGECLSASEIASELAECDRLQTQLETRAKIVEDQLRDGEANLEDADVLNEWFNLVNEKNSIVRRETELIYMGRECHLNELHASVEYQLRCIVEKPESEITQADRELEAILLERLVEIVDEKNRLIESQDEEQRRQHEENAGMVRLAQKLEDIRVGTSSNTSSTAESKEERKQKKKKLKLRLRKVKRKLAEND